MSPCLKRQLYKLLKLFRARYVLMTESLWRHYLLTKQRQRLLMPSK